MTYTVILGTGLWLGMLTSVSPCPLATNLAATAYLSRRVDSRKRAIAGTLAYTLGRVAAYVAIAGLLAAGLASAPGISQGLQRWMTPLLGPLLILTGMVLLGLISLPFQSSFTSQASAKKWASRGLAGELVLGFCSLFHSVLSRRLCFLAAWCHSRSAADGSCFPSRSMVSALRHRWRVSRWS